MASAWPHPASPGAWRRATAASRTRNGSGPHYRFTDAALAVPPLRRAAAGVVLLAAGLGPAYAAGHSAQAAAGLTYHISAAGDDAADGPRRPARGGL